MSKSVSPKGSNGGKEPLEPSDFLKELDFTPNQYANVSAKESLKQVPFNPSDYEYVTNPSSLDKGSAEALQAARQPLTDVIGRSLKQFGANVAGSIATSALNTGDVGSTFDILAAKETDFNAEMFGVSTKDIMNWSNEVRNKNQIYEKNPGSFSPGKASWWGNQIASSGTGVGMALYSLGETAAVGAVTEGLGAIPELFNNIKKFPQIFGMLKKAETIEEATRIADIASKLKRTATTYAIFNRLNESKMEAQQTYEQAYEELLNEKNLDGTSKHTEEEARSAASAGARRDFLWNMPLMALDILTYRSMVFNPFAGGGEGMIEKGIGKIATKFAAKGVAGKAAGWTLPHLIGAASEGTEEGLQFVGSEEGRHYAKVMAGQDDGSEFFSRLGKDVNSSEFWNNFAGGVIGSPIIGGTMKLFNKAMYGRQQKRLAESHRDFVANVGKMDDHISQTIREYEASGNKETADVLRRNFGAMKALSSLYMDGLKGSDAAFDAYKNFLTQTLDEVGQGKLDSLQDLGFNNPTKEQVDAIKANFQTYAQDADRMKSIFEQVSNQHEKQFVPEIAYQMFSLETRRTKQSELQNDINTLKSKVFGYASLSDQGKNIHDLNYQMLATKNEVTRLNKMKEQTKNPSERENYDVVIKSTEAKLKTLDDKLEDINKDDTYTSEQRDSDASIVNTPVRDANYYQAIRDEVANASQIDLEGRNLALWNKQEYKNEQSVLGIINSRTKDQLDELERDLNEKGKLTDGLKEAISNKRKKLSAKEAVEQQKGQQDDVETPVVNNPIVEDNEKGVASPGVTTQVQAQNQTEAIENQQTDQTQEGSVIPQGNVQSASPTVTAPKAENFDMFSEEMNTITNIANNQNKENPVAELLEEQVTKTTISNIQDIIEDGAGRIDVQYDGNPVKFAKADLVVTGKVATIQFQYKEKDKQLAIYSLIKVGTSLLDNRIYLEGNKLAPNDKTLWDAAVELGYAAIDGTGIYYFKSEPKPASEEFIGPIEVSLSPIEISDNLTNDQKEKLKGAVVKLLEGKDHPSFENLVRAAIKQSNTETGDKTFNLLIKGWELNGYPQVDYRQTYAKIFQDPIDTLNTLLGELATVNESNQEQKPEVVQQATVAAIDDTINNQNKPNDFDNNGQPIYNYTGKITEEVQKKFAFLSVPYNLVTTLEDDGTITINKKTEQGEINPGDDVDSLKLLDPNKYIEGTEMEVVIPSNYMDIKISTVNPDGTPGNAMPFSQYLAELENKKTPTASDEQKKDALKRLMEATGEQVFIDSTLDGTFAGANKLNLDADGNVILTRFSQDVETLTKGGVIGDKEYLKGVALSGGQFGGVQIATSASDQWGEGFFGNNNAVKGQMTIPLEELIDLMKDGWVHFANLHNAEFILSPHIAAKYLSHVDGQRVNIENSIEYRDKIPMTIHDKGKTNEKGLAFIHDVQWYNPINFNQSKPGEMEQAIKTTREMRNAVLDAKGKSVGITITGKRETTFDGLKLPKGSTVSLKEANPMATLTVATNINQLTQDGKNIVFDGELMNVKPFSENMAYDVRQTGRRNGKPVYTAFPLTQPQLSDSSKSSIIMALKAFINAKNQNLQAGDKSVFDNMHTQILASSGIDVRSVAGIQQYLSQFMFVVNLENANSVAEAEAQLKGKGKKEGYKYLTINSSGGITFGTLGKPMTPKNNGFFINPNPGKDSVKSFQLANGFLDNILKTNFLNGYQQHVHFASMNKNKAVVQFDMKGVPTVQPNYKEYLMNTLQTNVRSLNIGTAGNPNYITNVQPIITYEQTSKLTENEKQPTFEEIKEQIIPQEFKMAEHNETFNEETNDENRGSTTVSTKKDEQRDILNNLRQQQLDILSQARQELGLDFITNLDDVDLAPIELTEEQRESIEESTKSIAGLNPQQQSELIDFMYNQVAIQIDIDNKEGVSKEQVFAEVKKNFESIIKPLRKSFLEKAKQIQDMMDADPDSPHMKELKLALASYQNSIQRINDIQSNYKLMEAETELKVSKYSNIHKGKLKENEEEDEDSYSDSSNPLDADDGVEGSSKEFGTDSLTENPDNKLTYAMRRFLGQIRKVDKDGKPAIGFLRLPTYVGSDTVASTVRDLLADVPSDFNVMMDKLERSVPAHAWLRELIDRLKGSTKEKQNQFVTVMSNHRLSMKFSMIAYDSKTKSWTSKVFNTFQSGLAAQLALSWNVNFVDSPLVSMVNEVYTLNVEEAQKLVDEYDSWLGNDISMIKSDLNSILPTIATITNKRPVVTIAPTGELKTELDKLKDGDQLRFKFRNIDYEIQKIGRDLKASFFDKTEGIEPVDVRDWLGKIGIQMSDAGFDELMTNGLYHNFEKVTKDGLYTNPNGLFKILATALRTGINSTNKDLVTGDGNPLMQSVVKSLANLESNFNTSVNSPNGRDNGKSIFGFTAPKFITDRTRDLKVKDGKVVQELSTISFSKKSLWLDLLINSEKFRDQFEVSHIGLTAMKEMGKKVYKDNGITKLSDVDHELTKLIMFWDTKQGEVNYNNQINTFSDTTIAMRMATMFVPTMSDKSNMMLLKTAVLNLEDKHFILNEDGTPKLGTEAIRALYEQSVRPELMRMIKHAQLGGITNISAYDKGAEMFMFMPELNYIKFNDDLLLIDAISEGVEEFNLEYFESRPEYMNKILDVLSSTMDALVKEKLNKWMEAKFLTTAPNGEISGMDFIDKRYSDKFKGTPQQKAYKAALDFELNSIISNANSFMLYAGDPAMYFKSKDSDYIQMAKDTFVNVGKRLANQIAPGTTIANSENEKYIQLFIQDRVSLPEIPFLKFATRVNDGKEITDQEIEVLKGNNKEAKKAITKKFPKSAGYFSIEGADAQEYTTWKEHLGLLEKLGKTGDGLFEITPQDIQEARELFASWEGGKRSKLTEKQEKLMGKVMQPMKPVYTGQIYDPEQDVMRTVYIKSSSFPLIPQLTSGLEIDKLRVAMEKLEKEEGKNVRASYQTANKVGSVTQPMDLWTKDGKVDDRELELDSMMHPYSSLILDRKNFRIQQDVPYKSGKRLEDKITLGTQLMKILFGNGIIDANDFIMDGQKYDGKTLHRIYNDSFDQIVKIKKQQVFDELGLDENGHPIDEQNSIKKLQQILKDEAVNRGYPIQDIEGLNLDNNGNFITPLWSSANSNRYESMLNAIISNRLIKLKFPGNSYVVGSEEGFKFQEPTGFKGYVEETDSEDQSQVGMSQDIKMRNAATGFIGEIKREKSSSYHSAQHIADKAGAEVNRNETTGITTLSKNSGTILLARNFEYQGQDISAEAKRLIKQAHNNGAEFVLSDMPDVDTQFIDYLDEIGATYTIYHTKENPYPREVKYTQNDSKIIWTSKWNGRGLQGSYKKDGSIQKAQVLVASKFRDNKGELIDLFTKKDGEYVYVTQTNGKWMLKEDMFDSQLMSLTSFRIPTSGHVSAAQVEIVGIIPAQNADLMIVPRNFTKQMGLDFDVDKQNTYQLWHYQNENGKFVELTEETKTQILNGIKGDLKDGTSASKLMTAIFGDELPNFTEEEIKADAQLKAVNSKLEEKLLQNKIIKIHNAILTNPNDSIQSKINGILSTDYAEEQADLIDSLSNKATQTKVFTPLSSEYQKMKMGLGAAGKIGTGAYSLDVTFHSLVQQSKSLGRPLNITMPVYDEEGEMSIVEKRFKFGSQVSDGFLGKERTIDGDRSIAEVLAELQNIALDNEKLQVMGRVGLNDITIDVSKVFALLGFDKGNDKGKASVQFTFLSQPIIKDFVAMIKNANSNMADFSQDKEQMVIAQLLKKYNPNSTDTWDKLSTDEEYQETMSRRMNTGEMLTALQTSTPDGALQEAILHRFLEMRSYGIKIRAVQTGINADAKGLGKSFFDVIARLEALNKIGKNNAMLQGAKDLIGEYRQTDELTGEIPEGYINIGEFIVKPTTLTGSFNIHATTTAYNLWSKHLPYDTPIMNMLYSEIMDVIGNTVADAGLIDNKAVLVKQEVFKNLKKYLSVNPKNGIINNTDDINSERERLYIDSDNNTSIAKYVKSLRDSTGNRVIDNYIKTSKLINRFEFDIQKNGEPSLIKFNNAVGEEFDEQYLYNSLGYLLSANKPLPDLNGKPYTTTRLAQDLVAYTMLGNATQEAIQFTKYIPVAYTNLVGYGDFMRRVGSRLTNDPDVVGARVKGDTEGFDSNFTIQFLQHNPERVKFKISATDLAANIHSTNKGYTGLDTLESFSLVREEGDSQPPKYVSIYNKGIRKGEKKFQLYINQGDGTYKRIPILGTFGMDEYNTSKTINQSLVNGKVKAVVTPSNNARVVEAKPTRVDTFGVNTGNTKTVLENISKAGIEGLSQLAAELAPFASSVTIGYADIVSDGTANGNNILLRYNIGDKGDYTTAMTILHEVTHTLTVAQIKPYISNDGNNYQVKKDAPVYVNKLVQLYNVAKSMIGEDRINSLRDKVTLQKQLNAELQTATTEEEKSNIRARMSNVALTSDEKRVEYGAYNINEFMAMVLTQPEFQREMAKHEFKHSGQSLLEKFKEILNSILRAIGVNYSEKSVTAQAINSIFELITNSNERFETPKTEKFDQIAEEGFSDFEDLRDAEFNNFLFQNRYDELGDPESDTGETEERLSPSELPSVQSVNKNNC